MNPQSQKSPGILSIMLSCLFGLLLCLLTCLTAVVLFLHGLSDANQLPDLGRLDLAGFFDSPVPVILAGLLILFSILLLVLCNLRHLRHGLTAIGASLFAAGPILLILGRLWPRLLPLFSRDWQIFFAYKTMIFRDFTTICALVILLPGAVLLSVGGCIRAAKKGGRHA